MNDIRAITLDLDDTLWDVGPVIRRAERKLRAWFDEHYPRITQQFSSDAVVSLRNDVIEEHRERVHDLTFLRRAVIERMAQASGYPGLSVDAAFEVFDAARNDLELFPDVRPALEILRSNYTVIAVTNGNASLERIGIESYFHGYVNARQAGAAKPERRIFDVAVAAGGATPECTLHVGDHPEFDVAGARAAGMKTAWVNRVGFDWPAHLDDPDSVVTDLGELAAMLLRERGV